MIEILLVGGYGKMGKAIRDVIETKQYPVKLCGLVVEKKEEDIECMAYESIDEAIKACQLSLCVVVDFSSSQNTLNILPIISEYGIPCVIGTTGFSKEEYEIIRFYSSKMPILLSSNMSKGITSLLRFLPYLVSSLGDEYDPEIVEIHHKYKKDAPSGTALSLSKSICEAKGWKKEDAQILCRDGLIGNRQQEEIGIQAIRGGGAFGTHSIYFLGDDEHIEITHSAYSRKAFARGAIQAALWLYGRPASLYSMLDID